MEWVKEEAAGRQTLLGARSVLVARVSIDSSSKMVRTIWVPGTHRKVQASRKWTRRVRKSGCCSPAGLCVFRLGKARQQRCLKLIVTHRTTLSLYSSLHVSPSTHCHPIVRW